MTKPKLKVGAVAASLLATAALVIWQQRRAKRLMTQSAALREQVEQVAALREEAQRLTDQLKAASESSEADRRELVRLRAQAGVLRQAEQDKARLTAERDRLAQQTSQRPQAQPEDNPFDREHGPGAGAKVSHAKHWGFALINYAANHQGQFPASFAEAAPFLHDELSEDAKAQTLQTADQFEILYYGLRDDLATLPPESTIIVREKQPWLDQQGKWCKAYGMSDGSARVRTSRKDDFQKWESIRIPKPKGK